MAPDAAVDNAALPSLAGVQVLVVDDHHDTRQVFDQALGLAGAVVSLAASAREALGYLDRVSVILTDYAMPGETGLWLLERVLERARPVPVILVTGYADLYAKQLATAPFARVLRKPVDPWQLCTVIAAVLGMV
jgi:CheY-like chemotaxis protein